MFRRASLLVSGVLVVAVCTTSAPGLAAPARPASIAPEPVVYLPRCEESSIVPVADRDRSCAERGRLIRPGDCYLSLPGDYAVTGARQPGGPGRDDLRDLLSPDLPRRLCTVIVPAGLNLATTP